MKWPGPFQMILGATFGFVIWLEVGSSRRDNPLAIGSDAPAFALLLLDQPRDTIRLSDLRGKVVLLETWNTGCMNCRDAMPAADALGRKYADAGLVVLHVAGQDLSDSGAMRRFLVDNQVIGIVVVDNDRRFQSSYQTWAVPWSVLIDRQGRVAWQHPGVVREAAHPLLTGDGDAVLRRVLAAGTMSATSN